MEAAENVATLYVNADADAAKDTNTPAPTSHPIKVTANTYSTKSLTITTRLRHIR